MSFLKKIFGLSQRITVRNPLVIQSPRLGFLNFMGESAETIINEDKAVLTPLFSSVEQHDENPPVCDVLLIYGRVQDDGYFSNNTKSLREIIQMSDAAIVVVASENDGQNYITASEQTGFGRANLIMTLQRKEAVFSKFFLQLFEMMYTGKSMLVGWVELAPQGPNATHDNCPETIFAAEISHIVFEHA
ncbi:MAG: hypothetical protein GY755_04025 [Chloroflexi bacterium]|nr:hypothetical protein [Chloroflexota bacterium]